MVICEDITKQTSEMEPKSRKKHLPELPTLESYIKQAELSPDGLLQGSKVKSKKKRKTKTGNQSVHNDTISESKIDQSDFEELRSVYNNCKAVIKKIESKYGHLLNLDLENNENSAKKRKHDDDAVDSETEPCRCKLNKKIIFDDLGNETTTELPLSEHICPQKLQDQYNDEGTLDGIDRVAVDYLENDIDDASLPEELCALTEILRDPEIEITYRNKVINKYQRMKIEIANEIKFNKPSIVEQLKANPDEILDFQGTNLASLQGYKI